MLRNYSFTFSIAKFKLATDRLKNKHANNTLFCRREELGQINCLKIKFLKLQKITTNSKYYFNQKKIQIDIFDEQAEC